MLLRQRLARRGLDLEPFLHAARREGPHEIAARLAERLREAPDLHLIGHSMGGLIVLAALNAVDSWSGRAVLLGPPVGGSAAARRFLKWPGAKRVLGAASTWLATPPPFRADGKPVTVIAGTRDLGVGRLLGLHPGPSDGVVHLDETKLPGARVLPYPVTHFGLLFDPRVAEITAEFIRSGTIPPGGSR